MFIIIIITIIIIIIIIITIIIIISSSSSIHMKSSSRCVHEAIFGVKINYKLENVFDLF